MNIIHLCAVSNAFDTIFVTSGFFLVELFKGLQKNLKKAIKENDENALKTCVEVHEKIYNAWDMLNKLYGPSLFVQFMINALFICLLGYDISTVGPIEINLK